MSLVTHLHRRSAPPHAVEARGTHRRAPVRWPWIVVGTAWVVIVLATVAHASLLVDHQWLIERSGLPWIVAALIFLACWQVMTIAMMLPSSMPLLYVMTHALRRKPGARTALTVFLAGYLAVWTGFATVAFTADTGIHNLVNASPWLAENWFIIGMTTLLLAGAYQFSPLKACCQAACRKPLTFFAEHYRAGAGATWRMGLRYALRCLGSCWALMLVIFGLGSGSIAGMAAITGVLVVEKVVPGGRSSTPFIGVALVLLALLWLAQPGWA